MADYKEEITLNERDSLQDMLNLEKEMVKMYSTAITEGVSKGFRTTIKNLWSEQVGDQFDVFMLMTERGYAKVESAPEQQLGAEKTKFKKVKTQLA